jgi:hypothetical protein
VSILKLTKTTQNPPVVTQSRIKRDWMDATHNKHAYQCLPMTYANVYGWELQLQQDVVVEWRGENAPPKILQGGEINGRPIVHSSIIGMVSFCTGYAFGTEENYETWIGGPPNYFIDGALPLSAIIPSSWWPDEFQMNWKITDTTKPVVFEAGMPFMFFTVFDSRVVQDVQITVDNLWDKPELMESRQKYGNMKMQNQIDNPWTWTKGIRTGLDADGNRIGPSFNGLPKLSDPNGVQNEVG